MKLSQYVRHGLDMAGWYDQAAAEIGSLCRQRGWDANRFIDVLAITSPRCAVRSNVRNTIHYMLSGRLLPGTLACTNYAIAHYEATGELSTRPWRGWKVRSFAAALKGDQRSVVVDVWICRALGIEHTSLQHGSCRQSAKDRIIGLAYRWDLPPCQTQAALWAGVRRQNHRTTEFMPVLAEG